MDESLRRGQAGPTSAPRTSSRGGLRGVRSRARGAMWAVPLAIAAIVAAAGSAQASGGVSEGQDTTTPPKACNNHDFGERRLQLGDCGGDVKTLNWLLRSRRLGQAVEPNKRFGPPTDAGVREFQARRGLRASGVANAKTRATLLRSMERDVATTYGPGLWGNTLACGGRLRYGTIGVAHRTLACGTRVLFRLGDRFVRTRVIDRGPFIRGRTWDLTQRAARKLRLAGIADVRSAVSR